MDIKSFLDSTYLKTAEQAGISELENNKLIVNFIQEAIDEKFKLVMVRPEVVTLAKKMIVDQNSKVTIGTVIDFPKGNSSYTKKINQAKKPSLMELTIWILFVITKLLKRVTFHL